LSDERHPLVPCSAETLQGARRRNYPSVVPRRHERHPLVVTSPRRLHLGCGGSGGNDGGTRSPPAHACLQRRDRRHERNVSSELNL
jgi:hypothetical protein